MNKPKLDDCKTCKNYDDTAEWCNLYLARIEDIILCGYYTAKLKKLEKDNATA